MRRTLLSLFLIALFASPSWAVTCSTSWARVKDWASAEVLTEPDLEGEFDNTNALGGNCGSVLGTHDHDNAGTDKLNAHASVVALSINAGLINTEVATSHQALVAQGDGTAGWVTAVITSGESEGDTLYFSSASTWARLAAGTDGLFLKTQGAGNPPTWAAAEVSAAHASKIWDADVNTLVEVEQAADQDVIRFTVDGTEKMLIDSTGVSFAKGDVAVKGWVKFDGATPANILDSFNVTSVTYVATGRYQVIWDTGFSSANYVVVCTSEAVGTGAGGDDFCHIEPGGQAAGSVDLSNIDTTGGGAVDALFVHVIAFGNQ